jgi:hypothetical protein
MSENSREFGLAVRITDCACVQVEVTARQSESVHLIGFNDTNFNRHTRPATFGQFAGYTVDITQDSGVANGRHPSFDFARELATESPLFLNCAWTLLLGNRIEKKCTRSYNADRAPDYRVHKPPPPNFSSGQADPCSPDATPKPPSGVKFSRRQEIRHECRTGEQL